MPAPGSDTKRLTWLEGVRVNRGGSSANATRMISGDVRPSTSETPSPCTAWISTWPASGAFGSRENVTPLAAACTMAMTPTAISADSPGIWCSSR